MHAVLSRPSRLGGWALAALLTAGVLAAPSAQAAGDTATVTGRVVDQDGQPLADAEISV